MRKKSIFDSKWLILILIPMFEPTIFVKINFIHYSYAGLLLLAFFLLVMIYFKSSERVPTIIIPVVIYRLLLLGPTIVNSGDYIKWGYLSVVMVSMVLLLNFALKKNQTNFFDCILILFTILLSINLALYIKYPYGLLNYYGLNFLGIRTRITDYAFPTIIIAIYQFFTNNKKKRYFIPFILSLVSIYLSSVSTAYIGILLFAFTYFIYDKRLKINGRLKTKKRYGTYLFVISCIITYLIVAVRIGDYLNPLISYLFGKSSTFSGRTQIWDSAIIIIKQHYWFGMGIINDGNFVPAYVFNGYADVSTLRQAHNQTLQLLYDGGIISTSVFYYILYKCFSSANNYFKEKKVQVYLIALFALTIMMITEIFSYYPAPYLLIFICYFSKHLIDNKEKEA